MAGSKCGLQRREGLVYVKIYFLGYVLEYEGMALIILKLPKM
jgi:hypothetical protein